MNAPEFYSNIETAIDAEAGTIASGLALSSIPEWDSLAAIGFIAMADSKYGSEVSPAGLRNCKTVDDLMRLIPSVESTY